MAGSPLAFIYTGTTLECYLMAICLFILQKWFPIVSNYLMIDGSGVVLWHGVGLEIGGSWVRIPFTRHFKYNVRCIKPGPRMLLRRPAICTVNMIWNKYLQQQQQNPGKDCSIWSLGISIHSPHFPHSTQVWMDAGWNRGRTCDKTDILSKSSRNTLHVTETGDKWFCWRREMRDENFEWGFRGQVFHDMIHAGTLSRFVSWSLRNFRRLRRNFLWKKVSPLPIWIRGCDARIWRIYHVLRAPVAR
jgi:hypothetical protein